KTRAGLDRPALPHALALGKAKPPARLLRRSVTLGDVVPVDDVPKGGDVVGPQVLILEVVGVLPHVESEDRRLALHQGRILVRRAGDGELAALVDDQPRPAAAEAVCRSVRELLLEVVERAERAVD